MCRVDARNGHLDDFSTHVRSIASSSLVFIALTAVVARFRLFICTTRKKKISFIDSFALHLNNVKLNFPILFAFIF